MEFDIEKARELIRSHNDYIKNFYPEIHLKEYKKYNIPEIFQPYHWVKGEETIVIDVARLVRLAYDEANKGNIALESINCITSYFVNYCIIEKGMLFDEIKKENELLPELLYGEYDSLDAKYTNTTRSSLEMWLDIILDKQKLIERFESENESDGTLIWSARYMNEPPVNEYLIRRLFSEDSPKMIKRLIEALGENRVVQALDIIERKAVDHIPEDTSLAFTTIKFCRNTQCSQSVELLQRIESEYKKLHLVSEKYKHDFEVAYCKLEKGEKGLIELFHTTDDQDVKINVIRCYEYYRSKEFASLLVESMSDPYQLENGYFPVRDCAVSELLNESLVKLMEWFGYDIMDRIYSMYRKSQ